MVWAFGILIFGFLGGAVGYIVLGFAGPDKKHNRLFVGVPVGMFGLVVGEILFMKVFHTTGLRQILGTTDVDGISTRSLSYGSVEWDILVGVAGCVATWASLMALFVLFSGPVYVFKKLFR